MRTQIASEVDPFIGRVLDRHFFRPGCERKRVDSLHTEIYSPHPKRKCQLVARLAELQHGHGVGPGVTDPVDFSMGYWSSQTSSTGALTRRASAGTWPDALPKLTGFA